MLLQKYPKIRNSHQIHDRPLDEDHRRNIDANNSYCKCLTQVLWMTGKSSLCLFFFLVSQPTLLLHQVNLTHYGGIFKTQSNIDDEAFLPK